MPRTRSQGQQNRTTVPSQPPSTGRDSARGFTIHIPAPVLAAAMDIEGYSTEHPMYVSRTPSPVITIEEPEHVIPVISPSAGSIEAPLVGIGERPVVREIPPLVGAPPSDTRLQYRLVTLPDRSTTVRQQAQSPSPSTEARTVREIPPLVGAPTSATRVQYLLVTLPDGSTTVVPRQQLGGRKRRKSKKRRKRGKGGKTRGKKN